VAAVKGQAPAADALCEVLSEPDQLLNPAVEFLTPRLAQDRPIFLGWGSLLRKVIQGRTDGRELDSDKLGGTDKRKPPQRVASIATLVSCISGARNEALTLVEVQRRD